jgi:asparagine synthase (glutamine-hydrolysing)
MSRRLAGVFDPRGRGDAGLAARALGPDPAQTVSGAGLALAFTGAPAPDAAPLCLLDGFLDNADELRRALERDGARPPGDGAEALLAAGFRRWGAELPGRMRGDFALLVWDGGRGEGLLARDQLGVRPLFVQRADGALRFAGEVRDLLGLLPSTPAPDRAGVAHWIGLSSRPSPDTLYVGVSRLGPGEMLRFGPAGIDRSRYWAPRFREPLSLPAGELAERVRDGLRAGVERRLDADCGTGVLLSGGLDSASVAAAGDERLLACSGTFPEHQAADEAELIAGLRTSLGLRGLVAEVRPGGLLAAALEYLAAWRLPQGGWEEFWLQPLMLAAAAKGVGTMLSGDGGDEVFAPRVYAIADALRAGRPRRVLELARRLPGAGSHIGRRQEAETIARIALPGAMPPLPSFLARAPLGRGGAPPWLRRSTVAALARSDDPGIWKRLDGPRWWANAAYGIAYGIERAGVFEHQRRGAAMAGLELRYPMLDLDLVELALGEQPGETLDARFTRPTLRLAMEGLLPDAVRLRPAKALFESLIISCLGGADRDAVRRLLTAPDAELGAYVDLKRMGAALFGSEALLQEQPFRWMWQVWRLLNMELWLRSQDPSIPLLEPNTTLSSQRISVSEN